jgi:hypothetical protein
MNKAAGALDRPHPPSTPEELRKFFAAESQRWSKVVETAKIPKLGGERKIYLASPGGATTALG